MAIFCKKLLQTGITVSYHRVIEVISNYASGVCIFTIGSYIDEDARRSGRTPIETRQTTVFFDGGLIPENPRSALYEKAQAPAQVLTKVDDENSTLQMNWLAEDYPAATPC